jgi:hypothetical protein
MSRTALVDTNYELIKGHILNPDESPLTIEQQQMLDRVMSVARVMDKNPMLKHAVAVHMAIYPSIGLSRAYQDAEIARKLYNTIHKFDFDFWQTWLINDIVANIQAARADNTPASRRVIAMEHANLTKALGEKPEIPNDPALTDKHNFYIVFQQNNTQVKIDLEQLRTLPPAALQEITRLIYTEQEITEDTAAQIMAT